MAAEEPATIEVIAGTLGIPVLEVEEALREIQADLMATDQGIQVRYRGSSLRLEVKPQYAEWVGRVLPRLRSQELSPAAAWTLAVIALKQPVTLSEINAQRGGVDSSATLQTLCSRGLIARAGVWTCVGVVATNHFLRGTGPLRRILATSPRKKVAADSVAQAHRKDTKLSR